MRSLIAFVLLVAGNAAHALDIRCVNTVTELDNALRAAAEDDVEIRIVTGTYNVAQTCFDTQPAASCPDVDHNLTMRGGYNSTCSSRSNDPGATVLTNPGRDSGVNGSLTATTVDIAMDRFTWRSTSSLNLRQEFPLSGNYMLTLDRMWFDQVGEIRVQNDTVSISNSVFSRNGAGLRLSDLVDFLRLDGNTFANNTRGLWCTECAGIARNNIFWNNVTDLRVGVDGGEDVGLTLINNTFTTIDAIQPLQTPPIGTSNADPLFVNAAGLNYRLQNTSPAINSGTPIGTSQQGSDHDGGTRWFGDAPDRGAFESSVGTTSTTITVTNTSDSGAGSLRQAISDANISPNLNRIHFNIGTTCGPRIIDLDTALPDITGPVIIDGYTQPGAVRNTAVVGNNAVRCIGLNGQGIAINAIATATDDTVAVTIDGLGFGGFSFIAVNLTGGNGHRLVGSQFGGQIGPASNLVTLQPSLNSVQIGSLTGGAAAAAVDIGGSTPEERNVFSDSTDTAIRVGSGARNARIVNNYIGVGANGANSFEANRDGIAVAGRYTTIANNTISNNTRHGILVTGTSARSTEIYGNRIGVAAICIGGCSTTFGNANDGIRVHNGATDAVIQDNTIRFNGQDGVVITGDAVRIAVFKNNITDHPEQAIDLSDNGASGNTNNSVPPPPGSGNFSQNRPSMISAIGQGNTSLAAGVATGALNSSNGTYRIDFYAAVDCPPLFPLGTASPQTWLGATYATISNGTANTDGSASFTGIIGVAGDPDFFATPREIAATATRLATSSTDSQPRSTSEVSSCVSFDARLLSDGFE